MTVYVCILNCCVSFEVSQMPFGLKLSCFRALRGDGHYVLDPFRGDHPPTLGQAWRGEV